MVKTFDMVRNKVLIVDDEPSIRELVGEVLSSSYQVLFAKNGDEAIAIAKAQQPSVIVLDVMMPGKNGIETTRSLRADDRTREIPVLILSALNESEQRTSAFQSGADDYLSKPFSPDELLARVTAKIRRATDRRSTVSDSVTLGNLTIHLKELRVFVASREIHLGQIEFKILNCLAANRGTLVDRKSLQDFVWGANTPAERALDPHITTLRRKLKRWDGELKTSYGQGYILELRQDAA